MSTISFFHSVFYKIPKKSLVLFHNLLLPFSFVYCQPLPIFCCWTQFFHPLVLLHLSLTVSSPGTAVGRWWTLTGANLCDLILELTLCASFTCLFQSIFLSVPHPNPFFSLFHVPKHLFPWIRQSHSFSFQSLLLAFILMMLRHAVLTVVVLDFSKVFFQSLCCACPCFLWAVVSVADALAKHKATNPPVVV